MVLHPLEEPANGQRTLLYEEAEAVLEKVPRFGLGIVMRDRPKGAQKWDIMSKARLVRGLRATNSACPRPSPPTPAGMAA